MSLGRIWFRLTPWLGAVACGGAPYGQYWTDPAAAPVVSGISPNMVQTLRPGETVVVSGERLSATKSVIVGGRNAQIVSTSSTEVQISLPAGPAGGGQVDVVVITDDGFDRFEGAFTWRPPGADVWGDESASVSIRRLDFAPEYACWDLAQDGGRDRWSCDLDLSLVDGEAFIGPASQAGLAAELSVGGRLADLAPAGAVAILGPNDAVPTAPRIYGAHSRREAVGLTTQRDLSRDVGVLDSLVDDIDRFYPWSDAIDSYEGPLADFYDASGCWLGSGSFDVLADDRFTSSVGGRRAAGVVVQGVATESYEDEVYDNYFPVATAPIDRDGAGMFVAGESGVVLGYDDWSGTYMLSNAAGYGARADLVSDTTYSLWLRTSQDKHTLARLQPVRELKGLSPDPRLAPQLSLSSPLEVRWDSDGLSSGFVVVELVVTAPEVDDPNGWFVVQRLLMWADAGDGGLTVPATAMSALPIAPGDFDDNGDAVGLHASMSATLHGLYAVALPESGDMVVDMAHSVDGAVVLAP